MGITDSALTESRSTNGYADAVVDVYGWNWARVSEREKFVQRLQEITAHDFEWRAERSPAPSRLSFSDLRDYIEAIEGDFQVFTYGADEIEQRDDGVVVRGSLEAVSRLAREPFDPDFAHLWVPNGGNLAAVELIDSE